MRTYATYDEAVTEWRRNGIPEEYIDRKRLFGRTIVFRDDLRSGGRREAGETRCAAGEDAFLCRKAKIPAGHGHMQAVVLRPGVCEQRRAG